MENVTLALALLLGVGLILARIGKSLKLPSVTGYILAGIILGPSGFNFLSIAIIDEKLAHFTEIALMLIAFGIGEHIEFKKVKKVLRSVSFIGIAETSCAFILVGVSCYFLTIWTGTGHDSWHNSEYFSMALLLAAISVATAPAATLLVMRELGARGPLTSTLLTVIAIDNGLAIMFFGLAMATVGNVVAQTDSSFTHTLIMSCRDIGVSLLLGMLTGLVIDFVLHKLSQRGEMLSAGLALLLLCGESARLLGLSPLLAGMAAGCALVNRDKKDMRLFQALHDFEPPIYILFFTLAGAHLQISSLKHAGWVGLAYFFFRIFGKVIGSWVGARLAKSPITVQRYLGYALTPQAGVAIGLLFLISAKPELNAFAKIVTPVVLTGVVLSELVGPILTRFAFIQAGEAVTLQNDPAIPGCEGLSPKECKIKLSSPAGISITPWTWKRLTPHPHPSGVVLFGSSHEKTVRGLARLATIFAHHLHAEPMSVRVVSPQNIVTDVNKLFALETAEIASMGYSMQKNLVQYNDVALAIANQVYSNNTKCLVLGYPIEGTIQGFQQVVEQVGETADCPVVVVKFYGVLHTERILVPLASMDQLDEVSAIVKALSLVGEHSITLLRLLPYDDPQDDNDKKRQELKDWISQQDITYHGLKCKVINAESQLNAIHEEAEDHDLVVMGAPRHSPFQKLIFGSLADAVSHDIKKPMLIVYNPD
ncbi:MAG: cation:proton antiporter [Desulfobulbaceae bacterium]|jgi:Kef-type K+ transport system membrane component KefB/nucleotide-binding universal stress UspA family protein|nr:cation:proton antiporter [Desulfobulbaceae bacterium]